MSSPEILSNTCRPQDHVAAYISRVVAADRLYSSFDATPVPINVFYSLIGSFLATLVLSRIEKVFLMEHLDLVMIVGSFGAQATLVFAAPHSALAQPWNCIVGNTISATIGVATYTLFDYFGEADEREWVAAACAVSLSIALMMVTHSVHPPGGATTLIAVLGSHRIHETGLMYVLFPACIGSCIFVTMGLILNNLSSRRERLYPVYWLPFHHPSMFDTTASSGGAESTTTKESTMHPHIDVRGHHYAPSEISLDEEELEMSLPVRTSSPDISLQSWGHHDDSWSCRTVEL